MKYLLFIFFLSTPCMAGAQEKVPVTEQITIEGKVKNQLVFSLKDAKDYTMASVDSLVIYNHLHERKRAIKNIKGVLLKDILAKAGLDETNPKLLSEFYFTCIAADGYRIVFSWNEIFNTEIGNHILVVTEADGIKGGLMPDRILVLSAMDINTGRRFMKGISKIIAERVK